MSTPRLDARTFRDWSLRRHLSVEIEAETNSSSALYSLERNLNTDNWLIKMDGSLHGIYSREINSPIVNGDNVIKEISHGCDTLNTAGYKARDTCGLHVHVDCTDLKAKELHNLARLNLSLQDAINRHVPSTRTGRWAQVSSYSHDTINVLPTTEAVDRVRERLAAIHPRYHGFNMCALNKFGSIEFRHMEGSTNAEDILSWSYIVTSFIENGRKVDKILQPRTLRDKIKQLWAICDLPASVRDWSYMRLVRHSPIVRNYKATPRVRVINEDHGFPLVYGVDVRDVPQLEQPRVYEAVYDPRSDPYAPSNYNRW